MIPFRRFPDGRSRRCLPAACSLLAVILPLAIAPRAARAQMVDTSNSNTASFNEPSELFLKAFTSVQQGDKMEMDGQLRPALSKYRYAASILDQITQSNPNWQPLIVKYRQRKTQESIQKLEQRIFLQPPTEEPATAQSGAANGGTPGNGGTPSNGSDDLPQADDPLPGIGSAPMNVAAPAMRNDGGQGGDMSAGGQGGVPREAIDQATQDLRTRLGKSETALKKALEQLSTAKKEKEQALRAKDEVERKLEGNRSTVELAVARAKRATADRDEAQKDYDRVQARLKDALVKNPAANETRKELRDQAADLKKKLAQAETDAKAANAEKEALVAKLDKATGANTDLTKQRDDATAQSDLTKDAAAKIADLQAENKTLTEKLSAAEAQIVALNAESVKKKEEIEGMQKQIGDLKDELVRSRDLNDRSATTITELRAQLEASSDELKKLQASGKSSEEVAQMTKENEILHGIVLRQLTDQTRRAAAKKLITDELARLEVQSKTLTEQVEVLGQPTQPLSDEERALFKDPQITIADNAAPAAATTAAEASDPTKMAFNITAVRPKTAGEATADSPAPGAEGSPGAASPSPADAAAAASPGAGEGPKVETDFNPKVADALKPMAKDASNAFNRGKYVEAEKLYDKLIAQEPKNSYLLSNQGAVLLRQDKLKRAEVILKKAAKATPNDAFTYSTLGITYYKMHLYDEALECLTKAVRIDPKNAVAHNYLGITSSQKGWPEAAEDEISKAIALNPKYADAHFNIAVIYATNQPPSTERAQEHYRIATELGATPDPKLEKLIKTEGGTANKSASGRASVFPR